MRMTVYKGIAPLKVQLAINFDRTAVSLRLNMGYFDKINRM